MSPGTGAERLRIAHLTATFPPYPGGAGNTAYRFARGQAERGHHVEVFTAPAAGEVPDPGGAIVHRIDPLLAIGNAPLIPRLARLEGFDVVHLHYPFIFGSELALIGRLRRRGRSAALLVHYKNRLVAGGVRGVLFGAYEHTVAPTLIRSADRICVLSEDHARSVPYLRRALERAPERLVEMPNGVDTDAFSPGRNPALRAELGIPDGAPVVAFVATLDRAHHFKRLDVAIDALARLADPRARAGGHTPASGRAVAAGGGAGTLNGERAPHLLVAGGGELLEGFRARARAAGVGERVHFLGPVPHAHLPAALRAADVFLLTTEPPESFGIVLIEAMACGLPAIATDYPGVRAVVADGENGAVVTPGDPDAAAAALRSILDLEPDGRRRLGLAGRERCERLWAWPRLLDRMDGAYREAIAARRGGSASGGRS